MSENEYSGEKILRIIKSLREKQTNCDVFLKLQIIKNGKIGAPRQKR